MIATSTAPRTLAHVFEGAFAAPNITPDPSSDLPCHRHRPAPIPFVDDQGIECVRVALDREGDEWAIVEREDYLNVLDEIDYPWRFKTDGRGAAYVQASQSGGVTIQIARVILDATGGEIVRLISTDRTDLRRSNLYVINRTAHVSALREAGIIA
ncbi:hypothetical protein [Agrobacterium deltaense]|uniref:hypothetical protein n=1 Tax=Agrobacterium deltaense TaxID=1183412 RepID=UPI0009BB585C|nr:hypothetical protein [Agrobacterium deltaense]CUX19898.1 hypothetical protein AGR7B_Cc210023 [Agrobacterium deltaense RV3]